LNIMATRTLNKAQLCWVWCGIWAKFPIKISQMKKLGAQDKQADIR